MGFAADLFPANHHRCPRAFGTACGLGWSRNGPGVSGNCAEVLFATHPPASRSIFCDSRAAVPDQRSTPWPKACWFSTRRSGSSWPTSRLPAKWAAPPMIYKASGPPNSPGPIEPMARNCLGMSPLVKAPPEPARCLLYQRRKSPHLRRQCHAHSRRRWQRTQCARHV